jgi:hypothetical protein
LIGVHHDSAARLPGPASRSLQLASAGLVLVLLGTAIAAAAYLYPPPRPELLIGGGLGLLGILGLATARYEAAVALGFILFGYLSIDPAPPDVVFAAVICVALATGRFRLDRLPLTVGALLGLYLALNLLSATEAPDSGRAVTFMAITLYVAVFSVWLTGYLDSERRARGVVVAYLIGAAVSALLGLLALIAAIPGQDVFAYFDERARGLAYDPNVFGPFLIPMALILLEEMGQPRLLRIGRSLKFLLFVLLLLAAILSLSRGAWLNIGVAIPILLAVLAMRRRGRMTFGVFAAVIVTGAAAAAVVGATGSTEFIEERATVQTYDAERFGAQRTGIELAEDYPAGIGPGQFEVFSPVSAHSIYVRALAEQGVLGLATLIGLALATLVLATRNAVLGRHTYGIGSAALLAAWCGLLANSVFVDTIHWRHLWFVAALIWAGAMRRPQDAATRVST